MSSRVIRPGSTRSDQPPPTPVRDSTMPASRSEPSRRRITTGLVFTLQARNSEVRGSPGFNAKTVNVWMPTLSFELNTASPHSVGWRGEGRGEGPHGPGTRNGRHPGRVFGIMGPSAHPDAEDPHPGPLPGG